MESPSAELTGIATTYSYLSNPRIGSAEFSLKNNGAEALNCVVISAVLEIGPKVLALEEVHLFDRAKEDSLASDGFLLPAQGGIGFTLGFPGVEWQESSDSIFVRLKLKCGEDELEAKAGITMMRRIPR